jgi:hypothetical protein
VVSKGVKSDIYFVRILIKFIYLNDNTFDLLLSHIGNVSYTDLMHFGHEVIVD